MKRPKVIVNCVADNYADKRRERIVEFSFPDGSGGLIALSILPSGPRLEIYNTDAAVEVVLDKRRAGQYAKRGA